MIGVQVGVNPSPMFVSVSGSPDGQTAPKGTLAIDSATGILWRNINGGVDWWPDLVPARWGSRFFTDYDHLSAGKFGVAAAIVGGTATSVLPPAGRMGVTQLSVAAVGDGYIMRSSAATNILLGGGKHYCEMSLVQGTVEDGANRYSIRAGFGDDTTGADHADGVYFESSLAANGSVNWFRCTSANSSRTKLDTGVAPTPGTYQRLRFRVNDAGSQVDWWIGDVSVGSNVANIPTAAGRDCCHHLQVMKTLGATARTVNVDYYEAVFVATAAR